MANQKGPPPAPLHPNVARRLLDLLSTDDDFRDLFKRDAHAALLQAGYQLPQEAAGASASAFSGADCMQLQPSDTLASKDAIANARSKLEEGLSLVQNFDRARDFTA